MLEILSGHFCGPVLFYRHIFCDSTMCGKPKISACQVIPSSFPNLQEKMISNIMK